MIDELYKSTFPAQKLTLSKKNQSWKEQCVDAIIGKEGGGVINGVSRKERMSIHYELYNGNYSEEDLKYVTNPFKVDDGFPATPQNFNIIRPKIDLLLGEETKRPFNFKVVQTNDEVVSQIQDKSKNRLIEYIVASLTDTLGEGETPAEIQKYFSMSYKSMAEDTAYNSLNYLKEKLDLVHEFTKGFKDGLIAGEEVYYVGIVNGEPYFERVNPLECDYDKDPNLDFIEDGDWFLRHMRMTPAAIYDRFYDIIDEKDLDQLLEAVEGRATGSQKASDVNFKGVMYQDKSFFTSLLQETTDNREGTVDVYHGVWRSFKRVGFLTSTEEDGEEKVVVVGEEYVADEGEDIVWDWVTEIWEGYRAGEDLYFGVQPVEYQHISLDNPNSTKLPYTGVLYSNTNSGGKSLTAVMKPLQYFYIIVLYRLELSLARDKGKILTMDVTQIPKSMGVDLNRWIHLLTSLGVNLVNPYEEGWDIPGREGGKCFGKGTKVMLSNGRLINIEDIRIGDKVMGPDGSSRTVLSLHKGVDNLYKIKPSSGGVEQIVNSKHEIYHGVRNMHTGEVKFITSTPVELMLEFKRMSSSRERHYLYRSDKIDFESKDLLLDPYTLGLWLGDGSTNKTHFTTMDIEIIQYLSDFAYIHGMKINILPSLDSRDMSVYLSGGEKQYKGYRNTKKNWLKNRLRELNIFDYKDIPEDYIYNSRENRLKLLAGLIDTDGHYDCEKDRFEFSQIRKHISDKFAFIARSLGMKVSTRIKKVKNGNNQYIVSILSKTNEIPTLIKRKQSSKCKFHARDTMSSMFDISYCGIGEYYGFTLDRDPLFLLEDFTICHNSAQFNQFGSVDLSMTNIIVGYIDLLNKIEDMIGELSGVSKQRQGAIEQRELVGNVQRAVIQSSHITEPLFWNHNQAKKRCLISLLNTAKYAWENYDKRKLHYIMSDATRVFLDITDEFLFSDFDVFLSDSTKDQMNIESLRTLLQPAMQNGANLLEIAEILTSDNLSEIKRKLGEIEKRKQEIQEQTMQQEQAMQQQQLQVQMQMATEQNRIKEEDSIRSSNTDIEVALIQAEATMSNKPDGEGDANIKREKITKDSEQRRRELDETIRKNRVAETQKEKEIEIKRKTANKPTVKSK